MCKIDVTTFESALDWMGQGLEFELTVKVKSKEQSGTVLGAASLLLIWKTRQTVKHMALRFSHILPVFRDIWWSAISQRISVLKYRFVGHFVVFLLSFGILTPTKFYS